MAASSRPRRLILVVRRQGVTPGIQAFVQLVLTNMHAHAPTVLLTIGLLLCGHVTAQEMETGILLASLEAGSAQDIATAISSLPNDTLAQPKIAR